MTDLEKLRQIPGCGRWVTSHAHDFAAEWCCLCAACASRLVDTLSHQARELALREAANAVQTLDDGWLVDEYQEAIRAIRALRGSR